MNVIHKGRFKCAINKSINQYHLSQLNKQILLKHSNESNRKARFSMAH
jgi:hypothetical protein